jgi:hypothetical protein
VNPPANPRGPAQLQCCHGLGFVFTRGTRAPCWSRASERSDQSGGVVLGLKSPCRCSDDVTSLVLFRFSFAPALGASTWFGNMGVRPPVPTGQSLRMPGRMPAFLPIPCPCVRAFLCSLHSATPRLAPCAVGRRVAWRCVSETSSLQRHALGSGARSCAYEQAGSL